MDDEKAVIPTDVLEEIQKILEQIEYPNVCYNVDPDKMAREAILNMHTLSREAQALLEDFI